MPNVGQTIVACVNNSIVTGLVVKSYAGVGVAIQTLTGIVIVEEGSEWSLFNRS